MNSQKLHSIDVLRGLAILGVLLVHAGKEGMNVQFMPAFLAEIVEQGGRGVQLFFVASAFTLFRSFEHRSAVEQYPVRNFFIRRFFRIAPMYYIGIGYYLWQNGFGDRFWLGDADHISIGNIVSNFLFVHSFNPYWTASLVPGGWSISVEMLFYLLVPIIFVWVKNATQAYRFILVCLGIRVAFVGVMHLFPLISDPMLWETFQFFFLPAQLPIFALGIFLYRLLTDPERPRLGSWDYLAGASLLLLQLAAGTTFLLPPHFLFGIGFVLLALGLRQLDWEHIPGKVIRHIGKVSFSMYLCHFAVLHWLGQQGFADFIPVTGLGSALANLGIRYGVLLVASTVIATLFYELIEVPAQKLGGKLIGRWEKQPSAASHH